MLLKSKKFQVAVASLVITTVVIYLPGLEPVQDHLIALVTPFVAYIIGQGIADAGKERAKLEQKSVKE